MKLGRLTIRTEHLVILGSLAALTAGVLRFQESLTNGDYRRQLRARPRESEAFDALVRLHEPACFGKRPVAEGDVEDGFRLAASLLEGGIA